MRCYTWRLLAAIQTARRAEIDADLWDHHQDAAHLDRTEHAGDLAGIEGRAMDAGREVGDKPGGVRGEQDQVHLGSGGIRS